jgi:hypothetical protein
VLRHGVVSGNGETFTRLLINLKNILCLQLVIENVPGRQLALCCNCYVLTERSSLFFLEEINSRCR